MTISEVIKKQSTKQLTRAGFAALVFAVTIAAYLLGKSISNTSSIINDVFLGLAAAMGVHLLDRIWLHKDTETAFEQLQTSIIKNASDTSLGTASQIEAHFKAELDKALEGITESVHSLEALKLSGASQVYANREDAADDMIVDFSDPNTSKIRLIGVSLNDFVLNRGARRLRSVWDLIVRHVTASPYYLPNTDIKVLIIDPICFGAQLRSKAETRSREFEAGRLETDVEEVLDALVVLQEMARKRNLPFECRMYRIAPILFLCQSERCSYAQQYFFWSERRATDLPNFPVIKFDGPPSRGNVTSVHFELEKHFDWIWEKASVDLLSYKRGYAVGVERSICREGILNVYSDPQDGMRRLAYLLSNAERQVELLGISLHSFLSPDVPQLSEMLERALSNDAIAVRILSARPIVAPSEDQGFQRNGIQAADQS